MCEQKIIDEIDSGKRKAIKTKVLYFIGFGGISLLIGWLVTVVFWVSGTTNAITKNSEGIATNKQSIAKIEEEHKKHEEFQRSDETKDQEKMNEIIFNMSKLLQVNGLKWEKIN